MGGRAFGEVGETKAWGGDLMERYQFSRRHPESGELVFLVAWSRGNRLESGYSCAQEFIGQDHKTHICDLDLGHESPCFCEVHLASPA